MIGRLFIFFVFICIFTRSFSKFYRPLCITYYTKLSQQSFLYMQNNLKFINFRSWQNTLRKGVLSAFNNASPSFIHAHPCLYSCSASSCITLTCVHFSPASRPLSGNSYHLNLMALFTHKALMLQSCIFIFNQTVSLFALQLSLYISSYLIYQQCIQPVKLLVFFKQHPNLCVVSYTQSIFYIEKNAEWGIILIRRMHVLYHIVFN